MTTIAALMKNIGVTAKQASAELAYASSEQKHAALIGAADAIEARMDDILAANLLDLDYGTDKGLSPAMMDRLMLDKDRILSMAAGLRAVAADLVRPGAPLGRRPSHRTRLPSLQLALHARGRTGAAAAARRPRGYLPHE